MEQLYGNISADEPAKGQVEINEEGKMKNE
jgi:hypothetical protein